MSSSDNFKIFDMFYNAKIDNYCIYLSLDKRNKKVFVNISNSNVIKFSRSFLTDDYVLVGNLINILKDVSSANVPF